MQPATEAVLLNRLIDAHRNRRRIVFFVEAGLSLPPAADAPGVSGAGEVVRRVTDRLQESGAELPEGLPATPASQLSRGNFPTTAARPSSREKGRQQAVASRNDAIQFVVVLNSGRPGKPHAWESGLDQL